MRAVAALTAGVLMALGLPGVASAEPGRHPRWKSRGWKRRQPIGVYLLSAQNPADLRKMSFQQLHTGKPGQDKVTHNSFRPVGKTLLDGRVTGPSKVKAGQSNGTRRPLVPDPVHGRRCPMMAHRNDCGPGSCC